MDMKIGGNARRLTHGLVLPARAGLGKTAKTLGGKALIEIGHRGQIAAAAGYEIGDFNRAFRLVEQGGRLS